MRLPAILGCMPIPGAHSRRSLPGEETEPKKPKPPSQPSIASGTRAPHAGLPAAAMAPSPYHHLLLLLLAAAAAALSLAAGQNMTDADALMLLKKSFTNSSSLSSWLITNKEGNKSPCAAGSHEWRGVVCGRGLVTGLRLNGLRLGGTIDVAALAAFPRLRSVSFAGNNFTGALPAVDQLAHLKSMYLSDNHFTGALPEDFFSKLSHLKKLWLDGNALSGPIPASISRATSLLELHLERNAFSDELPPLPPPLLQSFNVCENDLEGVVPEAFRKFDAGRFGSNEFLCYVPDPDRPCKREQAAPPASSPGRVVMVLAALLMSAIVMVVAVRACGDRPSRVGSFDGGSRRIDMEGFDEKPPVYMVKQTSTTAQKRSTSWLGRKTASSSVVAHRRAASAAAQMDDLSRSGGGGDLVVVNDCKGVFGLTDLMKAAAEVIGSGGLGSAYKAVMANGVAVVVKRARDMNRASKDAFEAEMRRLGGMRHPNLLPPLAYHYRKDEKLLVYEYIPKGSLLYVLHGDRGMDYAALDWPMRLKVAAGIARGTAFLHAELAGGAGAGEVPHGNLKSANVLLAPDFEPLLVDFGFSGLIDHAQSPHSMFAHRSPECVAGRQASAKADVYCLGVVLLELLTGKFPAQYLHNAKGGTDLVMWATSAIADGFERDLFDPAIVTASKFALPDMARLMHVAVELVEVDPEKRPEMKEAAARVEEVVAASLATVRERQQQADGGESGARPGDAAGRNSHAAYVRDGSIQRITSVGERSSRRGSNDFSYGIS